MAGSNPAETGSIPVAPIYNIMKRQKLLDLDKKVVVIESIVFVILAIYFGAGTPLAGWINKSLFSLFFIGALYHYWFWIHHP